MTRLWQTQRGTLACITAMVMIASCQSLIADSAVEDANTNISVMDADTAYRQAREALAGGDTTVSGEVIDALERSAATGDPYAQLALASLLLEGRGLETDAKRVFELTLAAAQSNLPSAQRNLATLYQHGYGVTANAGLAAEWVARAEATTAEQNAKLAVQATADVAPPQALPVTAPPVVATEDESADAATARGNNFVLGADWVLSRPGRHFTIQVATGEDVDELRADLARFGDRFEVACVPRVDRGATIYSGLVGDFTSFSEAQSELSQLPADLAGASPWIRSYRDVQRQLRKQ